MCWQWPPPKKNMGARITCIVDWEQQINAKKVHLGTLRGLHISFPAVKTVSQHWYLMDISTNIQGTRESDHIFLHCLGNNH